MIIKFNFNLAQNAKQAKRCFSWHADCVLVTEKRVIVSITFLFLFPFWHNFKLQYFFNTKAQAGIFLSIAFHTTFDTIEWDYKKTVLKVYPILEIRYFTGFKYFIKKRKVVLQIMVHYQLSLTYVEAENKSLAFIILFLLAIEPLAFYGR